MDEQAPIDWVRLDEFRGTALLQSCL